MESSPDKNELSTKLFSDMKMDEPSPKNEVIMAPDVLNTTEPVEQKQLEQPPAEAPKKEESKAATAFAIGDDGSDESY